MLAEQDLFGNVRDKVKRAVEILYLKSYHAGHECDLRTAAILNDTLKAWQQEQEAQNG